MDPVDFILEELRRRWPDRFPREELTHDMFLKQQGAHDVIQFIERSREDYKTQALTRGRF